MYQVHRCLLSTAAAVLLYLYHPLLKEPEFLTRWYTLSKSRRRKPQATINYSRLFHVCINSHRKSLRYDTYALLLLLLLLQLLSYDTHDTRI